MNRRSFLGLSAAAAAGFTLDPDLAMWVPGKRTYFDLGPNLGLCPGDWVTYESGRDIFSSGTHDDWNFTTWLADPRGVRKLDLYSDGSRVGVWDGKRVVTYGRVTANYAGSTSKATAYLRYPFVMTDLDAALGAAQ